MTVEQHNAKEEIIEIAEKCIKCGLCKELCPVFKTILEEQYSPRSHMILLQNKIYDKLLFDCTLCKLCEEKCPLSLKICTAVRKARQVMNLKGKDHAVSKEMANKIANNKNPYL